MAIDTAEAPNIQRVMSLWLDRSFVQNDPPVATDHWQSGPGRHDFTIIVGQAKVHLNDMLVLDRMQRRNYLATQGLPQAVASRVFNLPSSWPDQRARNQAAVLAQECVSQADGLDCLVEKWSDHVDTRSLRQLLADIEDTDFLSAAITFATCEVADILNRAYQEAMREFGALSRRPLMSDDQSLPLISYEPGQTIEEQLVDLATVPEGWNGPSTKGPHPECSAWMKEKLDRFWFPDMPVPFIFPGDSGGFNIEWFVGNAEHSLEIDFPSYVAQWEWWNRRAGEEHAETLDMNEDSSWSKLHISSRGRRSQG